MSQSFITFESELPWIYPLAHELRSYGTSLAISLGANSRLLHRRLVHWPNVCSEDLIRREVWSYPPGFNRKFGFLFDLPIRLRLNRVIRSLKSQTGENPYVILPNPRLFQYVRDVDSAKLIYLNYDDYSINFSGNGRDECSAEEELVKQAGTILCSAAYQTERFKKRFPKAHAKVFHFPHGVNKAFINPEVGTLPVEPTVCISGRVTSRYDWQLVEQVVSRLPAVMFVFVGALEKAMHSGQRYDWFMCLQRVLARENVQHHEVIRHFDTKHYYWQSVLNWMPYNAELPFVKASCPLKIFDGLASGRPILSADVPECRRYSDWVRIYRNADEAVAIISDEICRAETTTSKQRRVAQVEFARKNTWADRVRKLVEILERDTSPQAERKLKVLERDLYDNC